MGKAAAKQAGLAVVKAYAKAEEAEGLEQVKRFPLKGVHVVGMAVDGKELYVADSWTRQIQHRRLDDRLTLVVHFYGVFGTGHLATGTAGNTFGREKTGNAARFFDFFLFRHILRPLYDWFFPDYR